MMIRTAAAFHLLSAPYRTLHPMEAPEDLLGDRKVRPGAALIWNLGRGRPTRDAHPARWRPGGMALLVILPPADRLRQNPDLFRVVESTRPHSILPFHEEPDPNEMASLLRRPPPDLAVQFMDYLSWRGIQVDLDTRRILRRTMELSTEIRTIAGLSRGVYLSRRALGRRFLKRGLPVPSHWLHFCRILRAHIRLQNSSDNVFTIACSLGYPDGFSLSNQMHRLTGVRPSEARKRLGWEWLVEAWLQKEAAEGGLRVSLRRLPRDTTAAPPERAAAAGIEGGGGGSGPQAPVSWRRRERRELAAEGGPADDLGTDP